MFTSMLRVQRQEQHQANLSKATQVYYRAWQLCNEKSHAGAKWGKAVAKPPKSHLETSRRKTVPSLPWDIMSLRMYPYRPHLCHP